MRSFRDLLEVGMICLGAECKMQGFSKPKLFKIPNLVMHLFSNFKSDEMVLQGFEEVFEKYLKGAFGMMQRDVRCIQNGHCPLQEKKWVMHFEKE